MYTLSVAIPMYNIEQYIGQCLDSLVASDEDVRQQFEVIVVNDGSKDDSPAFVRQYIETHPEVAISLIDKENGGHGSAINAGIAAATGKYFKLLDGDDWVDSKEFSQYVRQLSQLEVDLVLTDYTIQYMKDGSTLKKTMPEIPYNQILESAPQRRFAMHTMTYATSVLKSTNFRASERMFYVDNQYALFPMKAVHRYIYLNCDLYQYRIGRDEQSMAFGNMVKRSAQHLEVLKTLFVYYQENKHLPHMDRLLKDTINMVINAQYQISLCGEQPEKELFELYQAMQAAQFDFAYDKGRALSYMMYLNQKAKGIASGILYPSIRKRLIKQHQLGA